MEMRLPVVETEIRVGKELKAGDRSLYPLVRVSIIKTVEGRVLGSWLTPLAMLVIESRAQYAVSITGEEMAVERIIELAPSLKTVVEKARGIHRIRVS